MSENRNSNLSDELAAGTIIGLIFGIPVMLGIALLAFPFIIISFITGTPFLTLMQNLLAFAVAVFLVWLFSKYQLIENGIVGLIIGIVVYNNFKWHPVVCILIGAAIMGILFLITYIKIGFWIKTILFSLIITFIVYLAIYSDVGLMPLPDMIWKISFFIIFILENIYIRCSVSYSRR